MRAARRRPRVVAVGGLAVLSLLAAGCAADADNTGAGPSTGVSAISTPRTTAPPTVGAGATAQVDTSQGATSSSEAACVDAIGAQLRERTTVGTAGLITVLAGALPCRAVGIWAASFNLDNDPDIDPMPRFGAPYTGKRPLAVRLPSASGSCSASAVFFTTDGAESTDQDAARRAAAQVRSDLSAWPANTTALVPGGSVLRGRSSFVLAASVVGDPSGCSPGESVDSPFARVGDCWTAVPAGTATRFRPTACADQHTHEVYWADRLIPKQYLAEGKPGAMTAAVWARKRASDVCAKQSASIKLAAGVDRKAIFLEYLWPATLAYPPAGAAGWSRAQVVCLARWKSGQASPRPLLQR